MSLVPVLAVSRVDLQGNGELRRSAHQRNDVFPDGIDGAGRDLEHQLVVHLHDHAGGHILAQQPVLHRHHRALDDVRGRSLHRRVDCAAFGVLPPLHVAVGAAARAHGFDLAPTLLAYATAFATLGREIPCVTTAMGDEFGGPIPCGGFALIGGEEIGQVVVDTLRDVRSPSCILQNHGVFATGDSAEHAVKAAIMTEDNAAIVWTALQIGQPIPIAQSDIDRLYDRYQNVYGQ